MHSAFFIRINGRLTAFPFEEILYITAKNNYSEIVTIKRKFIVYVTLGCLQVHLPENLFCRVHRSHIVAVHKITSFDHHEIEIGSQKLSINKTGFEAILKRVLIICNESDGRLKKEIDEINIDEHFTR